jgi:hypothetical protein
MSHAEKAACAAFFQFRSALVQGFPALHCAPWMDKVT